MPISRAGNRQRAARPIAGFSLLEILVVLTLIGLTLTLVPLVFSGALARAELEASARELAAALRVTRARAVSLQVPQTLTLDLERREYSSSAAARPQALAADYRFTLTTAESERLAPQVGRIRFFPDGSSTGGRIEIAGPEADWALDVDWLTGRVVLQD